LESKSDAQRHSSDSFAFGTKAETLEQLQGRLTHGKLLPQQIITVASWKRDRDAILADVQQRFACKRLAVRSSSKVEDSGTESQAGVFASVLNVAANDSRDLQTAIERVLSSLQRDSRASDEDQILIQPQLQDVVRAGVAFSRDMQSGSPYYVINYDESGRTDGVTSGAETDQAIHYIYRHSLQRPDDPHMRSVLACLSELETITGNDLLDVEFACDQSGGVTILQVRPLVAGAPETKESDRIVARQIELVKRAVSACLTKNSSQEENVTVLSDMSDWNPAELIGSHPKPLAASLFDRIITQSAWRESRGALAYVNSPNKSLMTLLAGHPYIDVRASLDSYVPQSVAPLVRKKIVAESLNYLHTHPESHDKLEFEVATTCFTPSFPDRLPRWKAAGLTDDDIQHFSKHLLVHTEGLVRERYGSVGSWLQQIEDLDQKRSQVVNAQGPQERVPLLVERIESQGTLPFAAIARMAFVGTTFLKSFVARKAIRDEALNGYLESLQTVAGEMDADVKKLHRGELSLSEFLACYGHLRPGTFDITTPRYDERPDLYLTRPDSSRRTDSTESPSFQWQPHELSAMQECLDRAGMSLRIEELLDFAKQSIIAREKGKFLLSHSISDILKGIGSWASQAGLSSSQVSLLELDEVLAAMDGESFELLSLVASRTQQQADQQRVILPPLVEDPSDIEHVRLLPGKPSFVTMKRVSGSCLRLEGFSDQVELANKMILIESADPGFDWIFMHQIRGLVTKYGGAASHMAIRCSEFNVPAAIGAGHQYDRLKQRDVLTIDCANHTIY